MSNINVDPGLLANEPRVSVTVEDNAGNCARVWLDATATRKFADDLMAGAREITPDHSLLDRADCKRTECITHGIWHIGERG